MDKSATKLHDFTSQLNMLHSIVLLSTIFDKTGSKKPKMTASKLVKYRFMSQLLDKVNTAELGFLQFSNSMGLLRTQFHRTKSGNYKMTAFKSEILISQFLHRLGTTFQQLYPCFLGPTKLNVITSQCFSTQSKVDKSLWRLFTWKWCKNVCVSQLAHKIAMLHVTV